MKWRGDTGDGDNIGATVGGVMDPHMIIIFNFVPINSNLVLC